MSRYGDLLRRDTQVELTAGNIWIMVSAALALLMTPALGLFYGGMTRAKASLNMIMMSFASAGIVGGHVHHMGALKSQAQTLRCLRRKRV